MNLKGLQTLPFQKIQATGNDFVFVNATTPPAGLFAKVSRASLARKICHRHYGVGADGLVFISTSGSRLKWDFFNNDGSTAEMCGNASRCVGRWASFNLGLSEVELETQPGLIRIEVFGSEIVSHLDYLKLTFSVLNYEIESEKREAKLVNTGVPHAVVEVNEISQARDRMGDVLALRFHPGSGLRGANVTFVEKVSPQEFKTVTYERGVEGFTLSCGTGVLAAAAVGLIDSKNGDFNKKEAIVTTPGGRLNVSFETNWSGATLKGPAQIVFDGLLTEEILK